MYFSSLGIAPWQHMGDGAQLHTFLNTTLDEGVWPLSSPYHLIAEKNVPELRCEESGWASNQK